MEFTISRDAREYILRKTNTITIHQVTCSSCSGNVSKLTVLAGTLMMNHDYNRYKSDDLEIYVLKHLSVQVQHLEIKLVDKGEVKGLEVSIVKT